MIKSGVQREVTEMTGRKNLTVNWTLLKTSFFRLKQVDIAFTATIHELQTVADLVVIIPSDDELSARSSISPLTAHVYSPNKNSDTIISKELNLFTLVVLCLLY